jgi:diguanylate cyclase (GGDEF)-like protein/PAS domain S-box-containing protein
MMPVQPVFTIADLKPGDHLCCLYESEEEHRAVLTPFLRQGLERGEKVLYIMDARTAETILSYLQHDGLDVEPYLARGQLAILTCDDIYLRGGVFDPEATIALLQAETAQALAEGYPALRITSERTWALRGLPGSERLIEYEARLNQFFHGSQCLAICQYDRRHFAPAVLLHVLRTHPIAVVGTETHANFYYISPDELLGHDLPAAELHHWLQGLVARKRAEQALRRSVERLDALREVGLELAAELNLDSLLHSIVSRAIDLLGGELGGLYLYHRDRDVLEWVVSVGGGPPSGSTLHRSEGLAGKVWETGEPLIVDDYRQWVGRAATYEGYPWTAAIGVPIHWGEEFLGVLNVGATSRLTFSPADAELLRLFATQAANAIRNARLYEAERERRHIAETLRQASTVLNSTLELAEILGLILQQLRQVIAFDSASIQRLQGDHLEIVACQGFDKPDRVVGLVFPLDPKFPNYHVVTARTPFAIEDVTRDYPHFKDEADRYTSGRIRSWLGVPLVVKGRVIGMITLDRVKVHPYTAEEAQLAMAFANQAAIAIENARLFEETERLKAFNESIVQGVAEAILIEDAQGILTFVNQAAEELLGYTRQELIGLHWTAIVPRHEIDKVSQELAKRPQRVASRYETALLSKEGRVIPVIISARPLFEAGKFAGVLSAFTDITARKQAEEALRALLLVDELTGLYNRRGFLTLGEQQLKMAGRTKRKLLLLFADFDHLKRINDSLGHPQGDQALIDIADVLRETFRESDILARIGGDEFVVLALETDSANPETLTARLQKNLEAHNASADRRYRLSLSVGVARYDPEHPCSIDELLARADRLMYAQKQGS